MDKETKNAQPGEAEISFESVSDKDDNRPREFIEPLKELDDSSEGQAESNLNPDRNDENEIDSEGQDQEPSDDALSETDGLTAQDVREEPSEDKEDQPAEEAEEAQQTENSLAAESDDEAKEPEEAAEQFEEEPADEKYDIEEETITTDSLKAAQKKKSANLIKLAFSAIIIISLIIVLLAYTNQFSFLKDDTTRQPVVLAPEPIPVKPARQINATKKNDPYAQYRSKLREAATLRDSILKKQQEIQRLKVDYAEGIEKLENDILVEILDYNLINYEQALENKRVELGLQTIQRRQVYIQKLDDPMKWLETGSEELLYLKRRAAFDLQLIEIAGSIDMNMHMRHINAAIQKYRLTADNLAIDPEEAEIESARKIWQRLYLKTKKNPFLRAEINNWYIQQEICSGKLSRIGELSQITIETARCMSEIETVDLFLNNITELSPSVTKYLCQWDGKWLCLNGVNDLSPSVAQYLFQWKGEWISLNGLTEFPPDRAKYLSQWQGKQLELMGLQDNIKTIDRLTLTYLAEWERAGGKLFVPQHIRHLMDQL